LLVCPPHPSAFIQFVTPFESVVVKILTALYSAMVAQDLAIGLLRQFELAPGDMDQF